MVDPRLVEHFIEHGWARLEGAFPAAAAAPVAARATQRWKALRPQSKPPGTPLADTLPVESSFEIASFAPRAWELLTAVAGGEQALRDRASWSDGFAYQPPTGPTWHPPHPVGFGWHIDGDFSPPRRIDDAAYGLNIYSLWSDVAPKGGGTFFAPGALPGVARYLAERPEGVPKADIPITRIVADSDPEYFEFHGPVGTTLVTLSLIPHAASWNSSRVPRLLSVRIVPFRRPLSLFVPGAKTPTERATLRALEKAGFRTP